MSYLGDLVCRHGCGSITSPPLRGGPGRPPSAGILALASGRRGGAPGTGPMFLRRARNARGVEPPSLAIREPSLIGTRTATIPLHARN